MFPQACDGQTVQGTEADGPAQLVLLLGVLLQKQWAVTATICAMWINSATRLWTDPHNGERSDAREGCPVSAP